MSKLKVFCLPYAGGSKSIYFDWVDQYADIAELIPIEYSGHGSRFGEELYVDAQKMADDVFEEIRKMKPDNYILYGHSMGSLMALLVGYRLENEYTHAPKGIVIGGMRPPHLKYKDEQLADLPKEQFIEKIFGLGQMDEEIMNEPELLDLLYEIIHADVCADESFTLPDNVKLKIPMVTMTGIQDDEAPVEDMKEWGKYTEGSFDFKSFDDSHFFPFTCNEFHDYFRKVINTKFV